MRYGAGVDRNKAAISVQDAAALRAQFRAVAFTCDACHKSYRVTKK